MILRVLLACLLTFGLALPAMAADWVASRLRGSAQIQLEGGWHDLARGDLVANNRSVRTGPDSRLDLTRGAEVISLGPETEIRIDEDLARSLTIVHQGLGTLDVEAEVRAIEHLEVRTPFLTAVVKGTVFSVTASPEAATVSVSKGLVAVQSIETRYTTSLPAGTSATVWTDGDMAVAGNTLPAIFDANGLKRPSAVMLPEAAAEALATESVEVADSGAVAPGAILGAGPIETLVRTNAAEALAETGSSGIDVRAAGIGIAIGIFIGALALLARRFFA